MCEAVEIGAELLPLLEKSVALERELELAVLAYNEKLNNIDHELQIKRLNAPKLAKVMKYRQDLLIERRKIKDQYTRIKAFNRIGQVKAYLGHFRAAVKETDKLYKMHNSDDYIKDTGVVDLILSS